MKPVVADPSLVARCGLYCGACGAYRRGRCPGCSGNVKATWCTIRTCCAERTCASCADCAEHPDPKTCRKFHNLVSRVIGFVLRSDRAACVAQIRKLGLQGHAEAMARAGRQSIRRGTASS